MTLAHSSLDAVYAALHPQARALYDAIHAPVVVGAPPTFAGRDLCVTTDGEIRHYGWREVAGHRVRVYVASRDLGLNWTTRFADDTDCAYLQSPWSGDWIALVQREAPGESGALVLLRSRTGPGDPAPETIPLPWTGCALRQLLPLRTRRRWVAALSVTGIRSPDCYHARILLSDDDGREWRAVNPPPVPGVARLAPGDKRPHWFNDGCEPTVTELADGTLLLCVRTSGPHAAFYRSSDGGETWSAPATLPFFWQSNTMPGLLRLSDGRLLFLWNNTEPLPTRDAVETPELNGDERNGVWETVFTNRDALHAALSDDDGETWRGFREIALTETRDAPDFRELGNGPFDEHDKSVHQTQALELPAGKILVAYGQNPAARRFAIFDPKWLLETAREEDFRHGLRDISHHLYVRSVSGGWRGWAGHCAWNRVPGAVMSREPDAPDGRWRREAMLLARLPDPRLVSDVAGAVWNFPAMRRGRISATCRVEGEGFHLALCDHWVNPCDTFHARRAPWHAFLTRELIGEGWREASVRWDCDTGLAILSVDGKERLRASLASIPAFGFSYLHLQTVEDHPDPHGTYFRALRAEVE